MNAVVNGNTEHDTQQHEEDLKQHDAGDLFDNDPLDSFIAGFGGDDAAVNVHLFKRSSGEASRKATWLDDWELGEFTSSEIFRRCRDEFGGGIFFLQVKNAKSQVVRTSKNFEVVGNGSAKGADAGLGDSQKLAAVIAEANRPMLEALAALANKADQPSVEQKLEEFLRFKDLFGLGNAGAPKSLADQLKELAAVKGVIAELGFSEGSDNWAKELSPTLKVLVTKLFEGKAGEEVPDLLGDESDQEEEEEANTFDLEGTLARVNEFAELAADPGKVARMVREEAGEYWGALLKFLLDKNWFGQIVILEPEAAQHEKFYQALHAEIISIGKAEQREAKKQRARTQGPKTAKKQQAGNGKNAGGNAQADKGGKADATG